MESMKTTSALILIIGLTSCLSFGQWPQFLGPQGTGLSEEALPADPKPVKKWEQSIGKGFSSLSVMDGLVYTLGFADGKETVWCLNLETGTPLWTHSYPAKLLPNLHEGGPAATPTLFGDAVFTLGKEGLGFCLNRKTGEVIWQIDVNERFTLKTPEWGYASSGREADGRLILDVGPTICLDASTGKTIWKTKPFKAGYGSPTFFDQDEKSYCAVLNNEGLIVLQTSDGAVVDFYAWPTSFETNATTPIYRNRALFISTAYNKGCALLAFDGTHLTRVYENKDMRNHMNNSVPVGEHLIGFDRKAHNRRLVKLRCMEWKSGRITWEQEELGCGSLIRAKDRLIILSDQGELVLAEATAAAYVELSRFKILEGKCWTHPVWVNGRLLARNAAGTLVCYQL
jgi:outer membrane protein assembly factor BamB